MLIEGGMCTACVRAACAQVIEGDMGSTQTDIERLAGQVRSASHHAPRRLPHGALHLASHLLSHACIAACDTQCTARCTGVHH